MEGRAGNKYCKDWGSSYAPCCFNGNIGLQEEGDCGNKGLQEGGEIVYPTSDIPLCLNDSRTENPTTFNSQEFILLGDEKDQWKEQGWESLGLTVCSAAVEL
jgi:hypothetical protein